jgi:hypothetical protein
MQFERRFLGPRKLSRSILVTALFLACFPGLIVYSFWRPSEHWTFGSRRSHSRPAQPHSSTIPKKLWYKLGPNGLNDETRAWTDSCIGNNTNYEVEFMTDSSADRYVQSTFGASHPDLVEIYLGLTGLYLSPKCQLRLHDFLTVMRRNQSPYGKPTSCDTSSSSPKEASTSTSMSPAMHPSASGSSRSMKTALVSSSAWSSMPAGPASSSASLRHGP